VTALAFVILRDGASRLPKVRLSLLRATEIRFLKLTHE
jgi:hypothetical protein